MEKEHYWTRITGKHWSDSGWHDELEAINIFGKDRESECVWQWSRAHIEISRRMGLFFDYEQYNCSGEKNQALGLLNASDNYKLILLPKHVSNGVNKTMTLRNATIDTTDHGA